MYLPVFGLNTEIYRVNFQIQSEYRKIRTRKNSVFGHFLRSDIRRVDIKTSLKLIEKSNYSWCKTTWHQKIKTYFFCSRYFLVNRRVFEMPLWNNIIYYTNHEKKFNPNVWLLNILGITLVDSVKNPVIGGPTLIFVNNTTKLSFARRKITRLHSDALRDLVPFVQFKKPEKHPWRSITFSKVAGFKALSCRLPNGFSSHF